MSGFPVNLDLSEYFDDLRKFSSVFVNLSNCKDVGDVENHIKSLFGLEEDICLVHKKFLIPRSETIQLLQQYDIFKVQKCNFYDVQIHKSKRGTSNSTCEQKALNLTQAEKTIDLSCRPKQRLKANVCPGTSGTLTQHTNNKSCTDSQIVSPVRAISVNGNQNSSREKPKHKKKRHFQSDESENCGAEGNILDMSVKSAKRKKHSNCFSTDDGSLSSENVNDNECKDTTKDLHKKHKKRKKQSEVLDNNDSFDLHEALGDVIGVKDQNIKRKSKKIREDNMNGGYSSDDNKAVAKNEATDFVGCYSKDDEYSCRKKSKHKKCVESEEDLQENQYYTSSHFCTSKNNSKTKSSSSNKSNNQRENSNSIKPFTLEEEQKKRIQFEIHKIISNLDKNSLDTNNQADDSDKESVASIKNLGTDINPQRDGEVGPISIAENTKLESCPEFDCSNPKKKRKRKHSKKKKREKLLSMFAVGPALNQLARKSNHSTGNTTTTKSTSSSEGGKHFFFREDYFIEDLKISAPPPLQCETKKDPSPPSDNSAEVASHQDQPSPKPITWQDQLLKLASTSTKPVVFHRNTALTTISKPQVSPPQDNKEHSKPSLNENEIECKGSQIEERKVIQNSVGIQGIESSLTTEDFRSCNGEVKTEDKTSCPQIDNGSSARKVMPYNSTPLPLPNDFQNINLTDYPIIDKVVTDDLILFKVLKLNENNDPGVTKPILAKVNGSSSFPERISLQIMEGSEECSHCPRTDEDCSIELQWSEILEPRLFYP